MPVTFYEIEFPLADVDSAVIEESLLDMGALSITFMDRGNEPILEPRPGEFRLWSETLVRALFTASSDAQLNMQRLRELLGPERSSTVKQRLVEDRDWERVCLSDWKSMRFGSRLWVCPTTAPEPSDPSAIVVRLDPGLAFGTGTHPTTALCLQILDSLPLYGRRIIDYGSGSGILGIAALKLGACHVTAVDLDPQAQWATRQNAERNGVSANLEVLGVPAELIPAQCVVANILAGPLIELAPLLTQACAAGGDLLLSGLLRTQAHEVKAAYAHGFTSARIINRDDWCCIHARRAV